MNVARAAIDRAGDDLADEADDGGIVVRIPKLAEHFFQRDGCFRGFLLQDFIDGFLNGVASAVVEVLAIQNVPLRRRNDLDAQPADLMKRVDGDHVKRVGQCHR